MSETFASSAMTDEEKCRSLLRDAAMLAKNAQAKTWKGRDPHPQIMETLTLAQVFATLATLPKENPE